MQLAVTSGVTGPHARFLATLGVTIPKGPVSAPMAKPPAAEFSMSSSMLRGLVLPRKVSTPLTSERSFWPKKPLSPGEKQDRVFTDALAGRSKANSRAVVRNLLKQKDFRKNLNQKGDFGSTKLDRVLRNVFDTEYLVKAQAWEGFNLTDREKTRIQQKNVMVGVARMLVAAGAVATPDGVGKGLQSPVSSLTVARIGLSKLPKKRTMPNRKGPA